MTVHASFLHLFALCRRYAFFLRPLLILFGRDFSCRVVNRGFFIHLRGEFVHHLIASFLFLFFFRVLLAAHFSNTSRTATTTTLIVVVVVSIVVKRRVRGFRFYHAFFFVTGCVFTLHDKEQTESHFWFRRRQEFLARAFRESKSTARE